MKPEDISQEVQSEATECARSFLKMSPCYPEQFELVDAFALAIMAAEKRENEACARLIEEGFDRAGIVTKNDQCPHNKYGWEDCEQCAVVAIRNRGKP